MAHSWSLCRPVMWSTERGNIFGIQELHPHILHLALLAVGLTELLSLKIYDALLFLFSNPLMVETYYIEHLFPFPVYRGKSRSALNVKTVHIPEVYSSYKILGNKYARCGIEFLWIYFLLCGVLKMFNSTLHVFAHLSFNIYSALIFHTIYINSDSRKGIFFNPLNAYLHSDIKFLIEQYISYFKFIFLYAILYQNSYYYAAIYPHHFMQSWTKHLWVVNLFHP